MRWLQTNFVKVSAGTARAHSLSLSLSLTHTHARHPTRNSDGTPQEGWGNPVRKTAGTPIDLDRVYGS